MTKSYEFTNEPEIDHDAVRRAEEFERFAAACHADRTHGEQLEYTLALRDTLAALLDQAARVERAERRAPLPFGSWSLAEAKRALEAYKAVLADNPDLAYRPVWQTEQGTGEGCR